MQLPIHTTQQQRNIHVPFLKEVVNVSVDEEDEDGSDEEGGSVEDPERPGGREEKEVVADKGDDVQNRGPQHYRGYQLRGESSSVVGKSVPPFS